MDAGSASIGTNQASTSTTPAVLVAARATRRCAVITNHDAAIHVRVGDATVTNTTGLRIKAGDTVYLLTRAAVYVASESGTPVVSYLEEYD